MACDGKVRKYRTVRRMPDNSPKKWSYELIQNLNATPWDTSGVTTTTAPKMQTSTLGAGHSRAKRDIQEVMRSDAVEVMVVLVGRAPKNSYERQIAD